jgi:hypothetical protein
VQIEAKPMNTDVSRFIFLLKSPSSSIEDRVGALRALNDFVKTASTDAQHASWIVDTYHRQGLNQLILDNVLKILLIDDRAANQHKKQLIRAELFLILANMLGSSNLFEGYEAQIRSVMEENSENDVLVDSAAKR